MDPAGDALWRPASWRLAAVRGANNSALALFSFPSLAAYERYRIASLQDAQCLAAFAYAEHTRCIFRYERRFFRPPPG
ncbi:NIPSNAP family protein [Xanthomonas campestris]|uniref:NIPSNAP family protein n=1 Tax=Xanthomonas campestris pv. papavericola TaxID=487881 RepID=A0AAJ2X348_XANCA|nr:NIPSNAP family protein [Xanthomonas campestris]MEC3887873.1 NIPSNAP family protein [Xanthomonas campestris pv. papavericola]